MIEKDFYNSILESISSRHLTLGKKDLEYFLTQINRGEGVYKACRTFKDSPYFLDKLGKENYSGTFPDLKTDSELLARETIIKRELENSLNKSREMHLSIINTWGFARKYSEVDIGHHKRSFQNDENAYWISSFGTEEGLSSKDLEEVERFERRLDIAFQYIIGGKPFKEVFDIVVKKRKNNSFFINGFEFEIEQLMYSIQKTVEDNQAIIPNQVDLFFQYQGIQDRISKKTQGDVIKTRLSLEELKKVVDKANEIIREDFETHKPQQEGNKISDALKIELARRLDINESTAYYRLDKFSDKVGDYFQLKQNIV